MLSVGVIGFIYLFNVMLGFIGRVLGLVGSVMVFMDVYVGIIVDMIYFSFISL